MPIAPKATKDSLKKLRAAIEKYRYEYHVQNKSAISSEALDSLKRELSELEAKYPKLITPDSPTQRMAGVPPPEFKKVRHEGWQGLFYDGFSEKDMLAFDERGR